MLKILKFSFNKKALAGLFAVAIMSVPFTASAMSMSDMLVQIQSLMQIVQQLQAQLVGQYGSNTVVSNQYQSVGAGQVQNTASGGINVTTDIDKVGNELVGTIKLNFSGPGYNPNPTIVAEFVRPQKYTGLKKYVNKDSVLSVLGISNACFANLRNGGSVLVDGKLQITSKGLPESSGLGVADLVIYKVIDDSNLPVTLKACHSAIRNTNTIQSTQCAAPKLYRNLWLGLRGPGVSELQRFLKSQGYYTYPTITGYFGPATERAVKAFQRAKGIVSWGTPWTTGYGMVGVKTREYMKVCGVVGFEGSMGIDLSPNKVVCAIPGHCDNGRGFPDGVPQECKTGRTTTAGEFNRWHAEWSGFGSKHFGKPRFVKQGTCDVAAPHVSSFSKNTISDGDILKIYGKNLDDPKMDYRVWIENKKGKKGILPSIVTSSGDSVVTVKIPKKACTSFNEYTGLACSNWLELKSGVYSIYTASVVGVSNKVYITVKEGVISDVSPKINSFTGKVSGDGTVEFLFPSPGQNAWWVLDFGDGSKNASPSCLSRNQYTDSCASVSSIKHKYNKNGAYIATAYKEASGNKMRSGVLKIVIDNGGVRIEKQLAYKSFILYYTHIAFDTPVSWRTGWEGIPKNSHFIDISSVTSPDFKDTRMVGGRYGIVSGGKIEVSVKYPYKKTQSAREYVDYLLAHSNAQSTTKEIKIAGYLPAVMSKTNYDETPGGFTTVNTIYNGYELKVIFYYNVLTSEYEEILNKLLKSIRTCPKGASYIKC